MYCYLSNLSSGCEHFVTNLFSGLEIPILLVASMLTSVGFQWQNGTQGLTRVILCLNYTTSLKEIVLFVCF